MTSTAERVAPMLMTVRDVQRETGLARSYVYQLINRGELPVVRIGRAVRIRSADLETFINERRESPNDE